MKKKNKLVRIELQNYQNIINYLINSYCLNPNDIITEDKIRRELKIEKSNILRPFLIELRNKNVLMGCFGKYRITFYGLETLMEMKNSNRKFTINRITLVATIATFAITVLDKSSFFIYVVGLITICCINWFLDKNY